MIGRFSWSSGLIFALFTIYGLIVIAKVNKNIIIALNSFSIVISIYLYNLISIQGINIYNSNAHIQIGRLYSSIKNYLPLWLDENKVFVHIPNFLFLLLSISFIIIGYKSSNYIIRFKN